MAKNHTFSGRPQGSVPWPSWPQELGQSASAEEWLTRRGRDTQLGAGWMSYGWMINNY
jgi:hypothetical protein